MKKIIALIALVVILGGTGYWFWMRQQQTCITKSYEAFEKDLRKLWEDHVTWTRIFIISALADLADKAAATERLLKNQDDLGDAIKGLYGQEAGKKLTQLLRDHILIAADVVAAAKSGDKQALDAASSKWTANADDLAKFLSDANPFLPYDVVKDMLHKHLELTTGEVVSRLKKDWKADIDFYDKGHVHMLMLSDALAGAIQKQFPGAFKA